MNQVPNSNSDAEVISHPYLPILEIPLQWGGVFHKIAYPINIDGHLYCDHLQHQLGFLKYINFYMPRKWGILMGWVIKKKWLPNLQIHFDEQIVKERLAKKAINNELTKNNNQLKLDSKKTNIKIEQQFLCTIEMENYQEYIIRSSRKLINSKKPIDVRPLKEEVVNGFECLGEYLYRILELCIACYHHPDFSYKNIYSSEVDLFFQIMWQLKHNELHRFILRSYPDLWESEYYQKSLEYHQKEFIAYKSKIEEEKKREKIEKKKNWEIIVLKN